MSSNCLVFHTSAGISSSPVAFLFSIFLSTVAEPISTSTPQMSNMVKRVNKNSQETIKETKAR